MSGVDPLVLRDRGVSRRRYLISDPPYPCLHTSTADRPHVHKVGLDTFHPTTVWPRNLCKTANKHMFGTVAHW